MPFIAPYWADVDIKNVVAGNFSESVFYRITYNDSAILNRASSDIKDYFRLSANVTDFSADLVILVTWYNVGFYGASEEGLSLVSL